MAHGSQARPPRISPVPNPSVAELQPSGRSRAAGAWSTARALLEATRPSPAALGRYRRELWNLERIAAALRGAIS